eukprot:8325260-Pyramimonas_sp.AAC.1
MQGGGGRDVDTQKRLEAAGKLWARVCRQLPRLGLSDKQVGHIIRATVETCLFWSCETRAFASKHIKSYQTFLNRVVRGATRQRLSTMSDDRVTMADLRKRLGMRPVSVTI